MVRRVGENGIGGGAVDYDQIVLLLDLGYEARQQGLFTSRISKCPGLLLAGRNKVEEDAILIGNAVVDDF